MPRYRAVPSLQSLSLKGIGSLVESLQPILVYNTLLTSDSQSIVSNLQQQLDCLTNLLTSHVPFYLYDSMAVEVLNSVTKLVEITKKKYRPFAQISEFLMEMNIVLSLTEVVLTSHMKRLDFSLWPKMMRYILFKKLDQTNGLEYLNLGSCTGVWRTSDNDRFMINTMSQMRNLKFLCLCFDCTDMIIQAISENCPYIQSLDVTSSKSVSDRSVTALANCKQLTELFLHQTSVTTQGLADVIMGLPRLQNIGRCDEFGYILTHLRQIPNYNEELPLKKVHTRDMTNVNMHVLVNTFPHLESFSLFLNDNEIIDLRILISLNNLKELKILSGAFHAHFLGELLEARGCLLETLYLEQMDEMDLNVVILISQCCPRLKQLVIYNCDFRDSLTNPVYLRSFKVEPFFNLEKLTWIVDGALSILEFILMNAFNLKSTYLGSSTAINHASIVKILGKNPLRQLEELKILYSHDMNMRTVQLILASCPKLTALSELEGWQGIQQAELKTFRRHITSSNFDLDLRPTLSL
ncbi:unnamed protein product [Brassicogethes aeneus]|uniref:Uncharacterized protein n=1 Tax=Brassicogethes aeneus TaxID=1431903 RepID=A0A9P0B9V7_BRAAE|nr:unnamed protein product [Brassicogethes aeneus]